jgi:broad specificity phosphatase PhoE
MRIVITRHGQTNHNINNIIQGHDEGEINDKGYIQVVNLSKKLKKL